MCVETAVLVAAAAKYLARCLTPFCWYSLAKRSRRQDLRCESVNECRQGVCKMHKEHLKTMNPNSPSIPYDVCQLPDFIDSLAISAVSLAPLLLSFLSFYLNIFMIIQTESVPWQLRLIPALETVWVCFVGVSTQTLHGGVGVVARSVMSSGKVLVKNKYLEKIIKQVFLAKNVWLDSIDTEGFQSVIH